MDNTTLAALQKAQEFLKAGNKQEAQAILISIVRANQDIAEAWYLLGFSVNEPERRMHAFQQVLRIDPSNQAAQKQIAKLLAARASAPAAEMPVVSKQQVEKKKPGSVLVWGLAGAVALLLCFVAVGGWWLSRNGLPVFEAPAPTTFSRHSTPQPTLTPKLTSTHTPLTLTHTPTTMLTPTSMLLHSITDLGPILAAALPAPTVDATPDSIIFSNQLAYNTDKGYVTTENKYGHLNAGESVSVSLDIDRTRDRITFNLEWNGKQAPIFTLTAPDSQLIDEAYARDHPKDVTFHKYDSHLIVYDFKKGAAGLWELHISASEAGNYRVVGYLASQDGLNLYAVGDISVTYFAGEVATIGASLRNKDIGLAGATLTAAVVLPNMTAQTISLIDLGNGLYAAAYRVPDVTGFASVIITAKGSNHGVVFTREETVVFTFASDDLQLTGQYSELPRDENGDGLYEKLDFTMEIDLASSPGEYYISAKLFADNRQVASAGETFELHAGMQKVTLSFDGTQIRDMAVNGPYNVTNLQFGSNAAGVIVKSLDNVWTTAAYRYDQFGK